MSGTAVVTTPTPTYTITWGATKPNVGDTLVLYATIQGTTQDATTTPNKTYVLEFGDVSGSSTTITAATLGYGYYTLKCYVYRSDGHLSAFSAGFSQTIEPTTYITVTPNGIAGAIAQSESASGASTHSYDTAHSNQLSIGNGVIVFGVTAADNGGTPTLSSFTIHIPNRSVDPTGTALSPLVTAYAHWTGYQYGFYFAYDNTGSGNTTCDIDIVLSGGVAQSTTVMTWTMTGTTTTTAHDLKAVASNNYHETLSTPLAVPNGGAAFALVSMFRSATPAWGGDLTQNVLTASSSTGDAFNTSNVQNGIPGAATLTITVPTDPSSAAGDVLAAVSFGP